MGPVSDLTHSFEKPNQSIPTIEKPQLTASTVVTGHCRSEGAYERSTEWQ